MLGGIEQCDLGPRFLRGGGHVGGSDGEHRLGEPLAVGGNQQDLGFVGVHDARILPKPPGISGNPMSNCPAPSELSGGHKKWHEEC